MSTIQPLNTGLSGILHPEVKYSVELGTKIAASFENAKRNLLKSVKGFEKGAIGSEMRIFCSQMM